MAHLHPVYDTDPHFSIDPDTRFILYLSEDPLIIIQGDHNSERYTFELPRYIEGHDMLECNMVQVHYINISSTNTKTRKTGVYEVIDLQPHPDDENILVCSWLISQNATQLEGSLSFVLHFMCTSGYRIDYAWGTSVYSSVTISSGIGNEDLVVDQYADILQNWYMELIAAGTTGTNIVMQAHEKALADIEDAKTKAINEIEAVEVIYELEEEIINNIRSTESNVLNNISSATDQIETAKTDALANITNAENNALTNVTNAKNDTLATIETAKNEAVESVTNTEKSTYATKVQLNDYALKTDLNAYAKTEVLGTQVTYRVEGTTLYINTK